MMLVSACLAGVNCKYNGGNNLSGEIKKLVDDGRAVAVCPELLGGCPVPRPCAEISGGTGAGVLDGICRVVRDNGEDVTASFVEGAQKTLETAVSVGATKAILKAKSPSCGCGAIYDGSFTRRLVRGNGVTAELLLRNGIVVEAL